MDPDRARAVARAILRERRFRSAAAPRPFRGLLHRLGNALADVVRPIASRIPGHAAVVWAILGGAFLALVVLLGVRLARRRMRGPVRTAGSSETSEMTDPRALDRQAQAAEVDGDLVRAVRLRFLAGLLRLDRAGAISYRPSLTTGAVAEHLRLDTFAAVASSFDEIVYGHRPAGPDDVELSKNGWERVLHEVAA